MPHSSLTYLSPRLKPDKNIEQFIDSQLEWFEQLAHDLKVPLRFLLIQTLMHMPSFSGQDLSNANAKATKSKLRRVLQAICKDYNRVLTQLKERANTGMLTSDAHVAGRRDLKAIDGAARIAIDFRGVDGPTSNIIQSKLHYIRSIRDDTVSAFGLFLDGADFPYAYVSFSKAARKYQVEALNAATGLNLSMDQVAIMTRAFAFDGAPKNSMSKLFHRSQESLRAEIPECKAIITALNPYLGFSGGIFTGSSYFPYALSPMEYWYNETGLYVPRSKGARLQQLPTPPIMWFATGLDTETFKIIECTQNKKPVLISGPQYKKG